MDNNGFSGFQTPLSPIRFQSQIGKETKRRYKEEHNLVRLSLARVVKVNYKYNTVDVVTTRHKNPLVKNPTDNGKFSARLPVSFGGRTPDGKVYGSSTLVTVGSLVLIGYIEGNKESPIVLNIYGDTDNQSMLTRTELTGADETEEAIQRELWQLFTLYPSMTYKNIDGRGNQEITFSGKTFMYVTETDPDGYYITDEGFDYDHLPSSRYANGELIEPKSPNAPTVLYVHQGVYDNHRVTFFIKPDGTVRVGSRHKNGEGVTFQELKTDGSFSIVQKGDTTNPEGESTKFSQFQLTEEGSLLLQSRSHKLEVHPEKGVLINGKPALSSGGSIGTPGGDPNTSFDLEEIKAELETLGKDIVRVNSSIDVIDGRIRLKADATVVDNLEQQIEEHTSTLEVLFNRINATVTREELDVDIAGIKEYTDGLISVVNADIEDVTNGLLELDGYLEGAFRDGVIEESEAQSISLYINTINTEKADIDARYTELHNNQYLAQDKKLGLENAKSAYDSKHTELINLIGYIVGKGKVTLEDRTAVDRVFADYRASLSILSKTFTNCMDAVAAAMAKEAESNAKNYTTAQFEILADKISSKVESQTFTEVISNMESSYAAIESQVASTIADVEEISKKIPYRAEIISTQGNIFKNGVIQTTLFCKVYRGDEDITDQVDANRFKWTRISDDPEGDAAWNTSYAGGTKSITITSDDVFRRATFNCEILSEQ